MFRPFNARGFAAFVHDLMAAGLAWYAAYALRFNFEIPFTYKVSIQHSVLWVVALQGAVFWAFGLYRGIWRYASLPDLKRIVLAVSISALLIPLGLVMFKARVIVPRSVLILDPILLMMAMAGSRLLYRAWKEHRLYGESGRAGVPVLILGGGETAMSLVKELLRNNEWRPVGLLDDNPGKQGRAIHDVQVLGPLAELPAMAKKFQVKHAIVAMPSVSAAVRRRAVELCTANDILPMTVPSFADLISGKVTVSQLRKIELDDLLGREPVALDVQGLHDLLTDQTVLVTGAGGSIGSELCRQIGKYDPKLLILLENNEFALYRMQEEFQSYFPHVPVVFAIGDVRNAARIRQVLERYRPRVIFHAAAYKHVPLMETDNAWEAIQNNVAGTLRLAEAAIGLGVERFVLISTDKAVNPTNVMGASKRLAEMVCQAMQCRAATRFIMVRFGNVLGSTGSVIPKFHEQIALGGPVTVTHPEITRYFMSIPEAAQLVLQAGSMGKGGEIYVLDMGEPVRIVDLARDMIRLSGYTEEDVKIVFTGLRPGEKLYEELLADDEHTLPTPHAKLRIAQARPVDSDWLAELTQWLETEAIFSEREVKRRVAAWLPEYSEEAGGPSGERRTAHLAM